MESEENLLGLDEKARTASFQYVPLPKHPSSDSRAIDTEMSTAPLGMSQRESLLMQKRGVTILTLGFT